MKSNAAGKKRSKAGYRVYATCTNSRCSTEGFSKRRTTVTRVSQAGQEYTISRLVCPVCGTWGDVVRIESDDSGQGEAA